MTRTMTLPHPDLSITLEALPEEAAVRGNAIASGDPVLDREVDDAILARMDAGDEWAWCTVRVSVTYKGVLSEDAFLGCCSYESEADFRADEYFGDLVSEAVEGINLKLAALGAELISVQWPND